jgi:hypothetical protein
VYTAFALFAYSHILSPPPLPPTVTKPCRQDLFCPSVLWFCIRKKEKKKEKWHFYLFKIATQGVSLWHFHVYMYYSLIGVISYVFFLSTLIPFLLWFQLV